MIKQATTPAAKVNTQEWLCHHTVKGSAADAAKDPTETRRVSIAPAKKTMSADNNPKGEITRNPPAAVETPFPPLNLRKQG